MTGIRRLENKLKKIERGIKDKRGNDYTVVFITTENNSSVGVMASIMYRKSIEAELTTEKEFINFFNNHKVDLLFINNIDVEPEPGSLADKVFNGELTDVITRNRELSYYWYKED